MQTPLVICTISNTSTSYSMSLYEMSLEKCLLRTLLHTECQHQAKAYSANSNEFLFCSWDVKSDILCNVALLWTSFNKSSFTTAHVCTASEFVRQLVFALYMYVSALQWWSGPHWYIHSHLVSDWADEGRGTDWCGWHNQVHQDPETRSSATYGKGNRHICDREEVDRHNIIIQICIPRIH